MRKSLLVVPAVMLPGCAFLDQAAQRVAENPEAVGTSAAVVGTAIGTAVGIPWLGPVLKLAVGGVATFAAYKLRHPICYAAGSAVGAVGDVGSAVTNGVTGATSGTVGGIATLVQSFEDKLKEIGTPKAS